MIFTESMAFFKTGPSSSGSMFDEAIKNGMQPQDAARATAVVERLKGFVAAQIAERKGSNKAGSAADEEDGAKAVGEAAELCVLLCLVL